MRLRRLFCSFLVLTLLVAGSTKGEAEQPQEVIAEMKKQAHRPSKSLHLAAAAGDIEQVRLLVSGGSDVNLRDKDGGT